MADAVRDSGTEPVTALAGRQGRARHGQFTAAGRVRPGVPTGRTSRA